ncbi:MAG: TIR domain-containing protein, partial [Acidobacteria bacterium]|nr:TIR domain-containing protein [Acidobacteriota bacterium]
MNLIANLTGEKEMVDVNRDKKELKAFISYSNDEYNKKHAIALYEALKKYERPFLKKFPFKFFLDIQELDLGDILPEKIKNALENSEYLIYLASCKAAESPWVKMELDYWCNNLNRINNLIIVRIDDQIKEKEGSPGEIDWQTTNALPKSVFEKHFKSVSIYADLEWAKADGDRNLKNTVYAEKINRISAGLHGKSFEKRAREASLEYRREVLIKNSFLLVFIILFLIALAAAMIAFHQKNRADKQFKNLKALQLSNEALLQAPKDNTKAIRIAEQAYRILSDPPPPIYQALSFTAYSSFEVPFYITQVKHSGPINSAVFSSDNRHILTASDDNTAKVWDLEGKILTEIKHDDRINYAIFNADDSFIITASGDRSVKIWNIGGVFMHELKHPGVVKSVALSPDKSKILTASNDGAARLWNLQGILLVEFKKHSGIVSTAVFSCDVTRILTASNDGTAKLWDIKGTLLKEFKHNDEIFSAVFSPKGDHILTASKDGFAKLWNLQGTPLKEYKHNGGVYSAVFSQDGDNILTASQDGTAKLWDLKGTFLKEFKHNGEVFSATFSPNNDEKRILTMSRDGTAKLWDSQGKLLAELNKQKQELTSAAFSSDGSLVITASKDGIARVWNTMTGEQLHVLDGVVTNMFSPHTVAFSPDGQY